MLSSKISKYVQNYLNNKEITPSEAKELYHRFERVLSNNENLKKVRVFFPQKNLNTIIDSFNNFRFGQSV